ncbi:MAG: stage II sporulation protein D [Oscillospiraceae bacterium]
MKIKYGLVFMLAFFIFFTPFIGLLFNDKIKVGSPEDEVDATFKMLDVSKDEVVIINEKEYLKGAVLSEIPENLHIEAIKAQVIATYTYASKMRENQSKISDTSLKGADFKVDIENGIGYLDENGAKNKFKNEYKDIESSLKKAINESYGKVVLYNNDLIIASYHTMNTGKTESSEVIWGTPINYLVSVDSPWDINTPMYKVDKTIKAEELKEMITQKQPDIILEEDKSQWIKVLENSESKTATNVKIGNKTMHGKEVRSLLSLRSVAFEVNFLNDNYIFTTYGFGHGVGLSQYGAHYMAQEGKNYLEILEHYYKETEVKSISEISENKDNENKDNENKDNENKDNENN